MIEEVFHKEIFWCIIVVMLLQSTIIWGQVPEIPTPQQGTMGRYDNMLRGSEPNFPDIISSISINNSAQRRNEAIIRDVMENERKRNEISRQLALREFLKSNHIPLPDFSTNPGTEYFHNARKEIVEMLEGKRKLSLKRTIFITENAFFQNKMKYEEYDAAIQNLKRICLLKMHEEKLDTNDGLAKLMMAFRVMTEVIEVKEPGTEKTIVHHPMKYDFDDYMALNNKSNYMVSKLLSENTGQCHSMPLLFLILAEELGAEAFWSFSPSHSFVKFKDKKNRWYNLELTQGAIVTDDFYMNSGFIKSKAIQTGIYLNPQSTKQAIAHMLNDLSFYYIACNGYDRFVEENSNLVLKYTPSDLTAYQLYANNKTAQALYLIDICGRPSKEQLPEYPQAYRLYQQMIQSYERIDSLGYEKMPAEMYHDWLQRLNKEKTLPENQLSPIIQLKK